MERVVSFGYIIIMITYMICKISIMFQNLSEEFSEHVLWACLEEIEFHTCDPQGSPPVAPGEVLGGFGRKTTTALQLQVGASTTNS